MTNNKKQNLNKIKTPIGEKVFTELTPYPCVYPIINTICFYVPNNQHRMFVFILAAPCHCSKNRLVGRDVEVHLFLLTPIGFRWNGISRSNKSP